MLQEAGHIKNIYYICSFVFRHIKCSHLMNSEVAWVLVSLGAQVQLRIILELNYLPDYLSISHDYVKIPSQVEKYF